jgi:hypothetical protein
MVETKRQKLGGFWRSFSDWRTGSNPPLQIWINGALGRYQADMVETKKAKTGRILEIIFRLARRIKSAPTNLD